MKVMCGWCKGETEPEVSREKSDNETIIIRKCSLCNNILASYIDEKDVVLEKVRTFQQS